VAKAVHVLLLESEEWVQESDGRTLDEEWFGKKQAILFSFDNK
jgi:hypothetical protein